MFGTSDVIIWLKLLCYLSHTVFVFDTSDVIICDLLSVGSKFFYDVTPLLTANDDTTPLLTANDDVTPLLTANDEIMQIMQIRFAVPGSK